MDQKGRSVRHLTHLMLIMITLSGACLLAGGCPPNGQSPGDGAGNGSGAAPGPSTPSLRGVSAWAYQIQNLSDPGQVDALAASRYDLLVLEPTRTDWSSQEARDFDTPGMVARLKNSTAGGGTGRKLVIAYIDVIYGAARSSGPYGDYVSQIDETLRSGFDGIYLDWVEGYENTAVQAAAAAAGLDPAEEMIDFIAEMRTYARQRNPEFLIIQQNAAALIDGHSELLNVIDAIAQEAVWFDGDATDEWNDPDGYDFVNDTSLTDYYIGWLDQYLAAGVPVFNCEYALDRAGDAYSRGAARSYVTYCTRRSLGRLSTTPPPGL